MANIVEYTIKTVKFTFDAEKLTPESVNKGLLKAASRLTAEIYTGTKASALDKAGLEAKAKEYAKDPNLIFAGAVRRGVSRPKLDFCERTARFWFTSQFFPMLKLGDKQAEALWKAAGGDGTQLKTASFPTEAEKKMVSANLTARDKVIAAKAKKLRDSGLVTTID